MTLLTFTINTRGLILLPLLIFTIITGCLMWLKSCVNSDTKNATAKINLLNGTEIGCGITLMIATSVLVIEYY